MDLDARNSLRCLVEHVLAHQGQLIPSISYEDLAFRIGRTNKHGIGHAHGMGGIVLKKMGHMLKGISVGWRERIPHIQCLVGEKDGKSAGLPFDGIREFWPEYDSLTFIEKDLKVRVEKERIAQFGSRWNNVLRFLGADQVQPSSATGVLFGSDGESAEHKALKEFVRFNPTLVGVERGAESRTEYPLPSLDTIDVMFKTKTCWTAVEVKSSVSDRVYGDYERGVYQVVKYQAILEAMRSDRRHLVPESVVVWLVLESALPEYLRPIATLLRIKVLENVRPSLSI